MTPGGRGRRPLADAHPAAAAAAELDPREDFAAAYETHYRAVYRAVRGVVLDPDLAEDVTQDAFLKAYRARDRYQPTGRVEAWLCTIGVREAISRLRRTALQRRVLEATGRADRSRPAAGTAELLDNLLSALSPKARAVVVLHFLHGYRYREIAAMLRLPEGTVASRLSQALAQMRRQATGQR
ncbi:MAG TPA: sigma-70 family RNA polymerase sigma factor [Candidatus Dormibacteraeota bacterium]|nr:sigma-70 family RNA polymerase sigma factor [Candidatus Dormibacteraeota bacterium]